MSIDRNSPIPLYFQLKQVLLTKIESDELKVGDIFPTEQHIQETYNVSRTTVRQALSELEEEGLITRHRGRGTFVAKPKLGHSPDAYPNLADNMTTQGITPGWKLLTAEWVQPDQTIYDMLQITTDVKVFQLERLRLENETPIGFHRAFVPETFTYGIDGTAYTIGGSLRYLSNLPFLPDCIANRTVDALAASSRVAALLDVEEGTPILRIKRITYSPDQLPVEWFIGMYRGDRFEYHIHNMRAVSHINA